MPQVIDASFAGAWILPDERSEEAEALLEEAFAGRAELAIPDVWIYEMINLLLVAARRSRIEKAQVEEGLDLIRMVPRTSYDHQSPLSQHRIAQLADRFGLSAYDGAYLELADRLRCPLRSFDESLLEAAVSLGLTH